jgi:3-methyl-2-oxobutanoate hydroxymethyltransferase
MKKVSIKNILEKKGVSPIICLTAYSKPIAIILDKYCDIILVGDSVANVLYGMKSTREVKFETMIEHAKVVKKFTKRSLVVFDMPYKTYLNKSMAYKNASLAIKLTKCDAVKLEGGKNIAEIVSYLVKKGIPVMGHVGLLPQHSFNFKHKGKSNFQRKKIYQDAISLTNAGAFAIVIECVVESLAKKITSNIAIPTIGIGSSMYCDGQILVTDDVIGLTDFYPKFVKRYFNIKKTIENSVFRYYQDVRLKRFPSSKNVYKN